MFNTSRLPDAKAQVIEVVDTVRIGIDAYKYPQFLGHPAMNISQVEPVGVGIELEETATLARVNEDALNVELKRLAFQHETAGRMGDHVHVGIVHRSERASGLFVPREVEETMDGRNHDAELAERRIAKIETAVLENVDFNTF